MPSMLAMLENNMPTYNSGEGLREQVEGLYDYLYQLMEQIRYSWRNIDPAKNFNGAASEAYKSEITSPIYTHLEDTDGNILDLKITAEGLWLTCYGEGGTPENPVVGSLSFTAREFNVFYHDEDGDWSKMTQTAKKFEVELYGDDSHTGLVATTEGIWTEVYGPDGKSGLKQTAEGLFTEVYGPDGKSGLKQTAEGLYTEVYGPDGHSGLKQTAEGLWVEVYGEGGGPGNLKEGCLRLTADDFTTFMSDDGEWSQMTQKADGLWIEVYGKDGGPGNAKKGSLRLTADDFSTFIGKDGEWSQFTQKADGIYATVYGTGDDGNPSEGSLAFNSNKFAVTLYGGDRGGQKVTGLVADLDGLSVIVQGTDGKGGLVATATTFETFYQTDGEFSQVKQTANGLYAEVYGQFGGPGDAKEGSLKFTADAYETFVGAGGAFSTVEQKANRIDWVVKNDWTATETSFTLTDRMIDAMADKIVLSATSSGTTSTLTLSGPNATLASTSIEFSGLVTFHDLDPYSWEEATTIIDGGVIIAGTTITSPIIQTGTLYGSNLYGGTIVWGDYEYFREGWGMLTYGSGYSDDGVTDIVCMRSHYGIKIQCTDRDSGIALTSNYIFCGCDASNFRVYYTSSSGTKSQVSLETLIRNIIAEEKA